MMEYIPCKQKVGNTDLPIDLEVSNDSLTYYYQQRRFNIPFEFFIPHCTVCI